jgi:hypothetical protein
MIQRLTSYLCLSSTGLNTRDNIVKLEPHSDLLKADLHGNLCKCRSYYDAGFRSEVIGAQRHIEFRRLFETALNYWIGILLVHWLGIAILRLSGRYAQNSRLSCATVFGNLRSQVVGLNT